MEEIAALLDAFVDDDDGGGDGGNGGDQDHHRLHRPRDWQELVVFQDLFANFDLC